MSEDHKCHESETPQEQLADELAQLRLECAAAPRRDSSLDQIIDSYLEDRKVNITPNWFNAKPWPLRAALALGALALLLALSQLLPFASGTRHAPQVQAYSGGYVLVFDLGSGPPPDAETHKRGMEIIHQWFTENGIEPEQLTISGGEDVVDGQRTFTLALIGASKDQAQSLADALTGLPGIPTPRIVEADWYQVEAAEAEKRGDLLLYEFDHAFVFSHGTTSEQIKQALVDYVTTRDGECKYDIKVDVEWTKDGHSCNVTVGDAAEDEAHHSIAHH